MAFLSTFHALSGGSDAQFKSEQEIQPFENIVNDGWVNQMFKPHCNRKKNDKDVVEIDKPTLARKEVA